MTFNFEGCKNDTQRSNLIREKVNEIIYNALVKEFGVEFVAHIPDDFYTQDRGKFTKNTVVAKVADITNREGFTVDILVECGTKVRTWNTSGKRVAVSFDDITEYFDNQDENEGEGE